MASPHIFRTKLSKILQASRKKAEKEINSRPQFIPLPLEIIEKTLGDKLAIPAEIFISEVIEYVESAYAKRLASKAGYFKDMITGADVNSTNLHKYTPAVVYENNKVVGVLFHTGNAGGGSFNSAKTNLTTQLNKMFKTYLKGDYGTGHSVGFDLGHTDIESNNPTGKFLGRAVGADKVRKITSTISKKIGSSSLTDEQQGTLIKVLNLINTAQRDFNVHAEYSNVIKVVLEKDFAATNRTLLKLNCNVVIIQDRKENQYDFSRLESSLVTAVKEILPQINFSRNLEEEIEERVFAALTGKKHSNTSKKVALEPIIDKNKVGKNVKTEKAVLKAPTAKVINLETKRAIGLPRLLALLNNHLQDVVSANMQDPDEYDRGSRKLLTYRTGRFAESVKVERLSASREGAITAFYSYMKNPYATFSAGGRQQNPRSRDPKSLISKSIREIAAKYVAEQMRAVNV